VALQTSYKELIVNGGDDRKTRALHLVAVAVRQLQVVAAATRTMLGKPSALGLLEEDMGVFVEGYLGKAPGSRFQQHTLHRVVVVVARPLIDIHCHLNPAPAVATVYSKG
jgi:hypothetical protein